MLSVAPAYSHSSAEAVGRHIRDHGMKLRGPGSAVAEIHHELDIKHTAVAFIGKIVDSA